MCLVYFIYNSLHIKHNFQSKRTRFTSDVPQSATNVDKVCHTSDGRAKIVPRNTRMMKCLQQSEKNEIFIVPRNTRMMKIVPRNTRGLMR